MLLLHKLFYPKLRFSRQLNRVVIIVLGLSMIYSAFMIQKLVTALEIKNWPHTEGVVIEAYIAGARSYYPDIEYEYAVDSQVYTGHSSLHAPMFGGKRKRHNVAETLVRDNPPGKKLPIYYNPKNPAESMVNNYVDWKVYGQSGFGFFMVLLSLWFVVVPVRKD